MLNFHDKSIITLIYENNSLTILLLKYLETENIKF